MQRRNLILLPPAAALSSCASRSSRPTRETADIKSIGLLDLKEVPATGQTGPFNLALSGAKTSSGGQIVPFSPATLGLGIGMALRASSEASAAAARLSISQALQATEFVPAAEWTRAFRAACAARAVPIKPVDDPVASERSRNDWDFASLPAGLDAVLSVQLDHCGYYFEKSAGGLTPSLYVSGTLLSTTNGGSRLERYNYESDYRASDGDRHFITAPPTLVMTSLDQVKAKAAEIRAGMQLLMETVASRLAEDIDRTVKKLVPV